MDTIRNHLWFLPFLHILTHTLRHRPVGQEHEFLHQLVGILLPFEIHAQRFSFLVNLESHLLTVEIHGTVLEPSFPQPVSHAVEHHQLILIGFRRASPLCQRLFGRWIFEVFLRCLTDGFEQMLHLFIHKPPVAVGDGMCYFIVEHLRILVHGEDDGISEFVLVRPQ